MEQRSCRLCVACGRLHGVYLSCEQLLDLTFVERAWRYGVLERSLFAVPQLGAEHGVMALHSGCY